MNILCIFTRSLEFKIKHSIKDKIITVSFYFSYNI